MVAIREPRVLYCCMHGQSTAASLCLGWNVRAAGTRWYDMVDPISIMCPAMLVSSLDVALPGITSRPHHLGRGVVSITISLDSVQRFVICMHTQSFHINWITASIAVLQVITGGYQEPCWCTLSIVVAHTFHLSRVFLSSSLSLLVFATSLLGGTAGCCNHHSCVDICLPNRQFTYIYHGFILDPSIPILLALYLLLSCHNVQRARSLP